MHPTTPSIPLIDLTRPDHVADLGRACREVGFFYIAGHDVDIDLQRRLEEAGARFFTLPIDAKMAIEMKNGGRAWRGYFPIGQELTSGKPDQKEGLYFGEELREDHPQVQAKTPLHGPNLFPSIERIRETILEYLEAMTTLGHRLMRSLALSLDLPADTFERRYTSDPTILFRIFRYPPLDSTEHWSVGEHTDYGLLTILKQDRTGGLQVRSRSGWIDAPPIENTFVVNLGDMLEILTSGYYRSTPHRVRNETRIARLSFPFFFDPSFDAEMTPIRPGLKVTSGDDRWDKEDVHAFRGTYGEYLIEKVSRVFPELGVLGTGGE